MGVPALFALGSLIVGDGLLTARLLALIAVAGTAALLCAFLDRYTRLRPAGVLAGLFYLAYMSRPEGLAANTEVFNNLAVTAASYLLAGQLPGLSRAARPVPLLVAALTLGIGLQLKYVVFPESIALCGAVLLFQLTAGATIRRIAGLAGFAIAAGVLPTVVATLYYWWSGALEPYLDATLNANIAYMDKPLAPRMVFAGLRYGLVPISGLLIWPVVLYILHRRQLFGRRQRMIIWWLAIWLIASCIDVAMPLKFWKHYFNALVPPLCLMAGLALTSLARERPAGFARMIAAGLVLTLVPAAVEVVRHAHDSRTFNRVNVPLEIGDRIKAVGTDGRDIYVLNYDPLVYAYTKAVPPTRFVLGVELANSTANAGADGPAEISRILSERPRWIVVAEPSPYTYNDRVKRELQTTLRDYQVDSTFQETDYSQPPMEVQLWRRRSPADDG